MIRVLAVLGIALAATLVACGGRPTVLTVDGVPLADADKVEALPAAPRVVVPAAADAPTPEIPRGHAQIQVLAHRAAPWAKVRATLTAIAATGARPVVVVASKGRPMMLGHGAPAVPESILLAVEVGDEVKACISPPDAEERMCSARPDGKHVDRAFVRELIREAWKGYGLAHVHVRPQDDLEWADVVRAIDGARTCCGAGVEIAISVEDASL